MEEIIDSLLRGDDACSRHVAAGGYAQNLQNMWYCKNSGRPAPIAFSKSSFTRGKEKRKRMRATLADSIVEQAATARSSARDWRRQAPRGASLELFACMFIGKAF